MATPADNLPSSESLASWKCYRLPSPLTSAVAASTEGDSSSNATAAKEDCWVKALNLEGAFSFTPHGAQKAHPVRILVLYGSLREKSFSRFLAYECARLLEHMGADVRVFNPQGLPVRDPTLENTCEKVKELRSLVAWSEGHVWVSPEMHGQITGVMKNQIDWIPLNTGSVRPTQGKSVAVLQVIYHNR